MPKELSTKVEIIEMELLKKDFTLDNTSRFTAFATTEVVDEVRTKYFRDLGISTVWADIVVDAQGEPFKKLRAVVHVEITYAGDMVRSSKKTRDEINNRLEELAQECCMKQIQKKLLGEEF